MARMIKSVVEMVYGVKLSTVFENGDVVDRVFKTNDVVNNLRYVKDGEIEIVSGRISELVFSIPKVTWDPSNPTDALKNDMKLSSLIIDASEQFNSKFVEVPLREIVEFEDEKPVARMKYEPYILCNMSLKYSDYRVENASIEVGDVFDKVMILDLENIENPIRGKFEVLGFAYKFEDNKIKVLGIGFKNADTGKMVVAGFNEIMALNEVYNFEIPDAAAITEVISSLNPGDTVKIPVTGLNTTGNVINLTKENISLNLEGNLIAAGDAASGIIASGNGSVTLSGDGVIVNTTPYDAAHSNGVVKAKGNSKVTFNGSGVVAVIDDDPVNKGQFGVVIYDAAKVTVNDGFFKTGWYCISGNGSATTKDAVVEINGGSFTSVADYTVYHPDAGKLVINGGTFAGAAGAIAANNGVIEINGGEFAVLGNGNTGEWADGTSGLSDVAINLNAKYGDVVCRITGGTFHATAAGTIMIATGTAHNVDLKITGGKFTSKPNAEWIETGYICTAEPDSDGYYHVVKGLQ